MKNSPTLSSLAFSIAVLAILASSIGLYSTDVGDPLPFATLRGQTVQLFGRGLYRHDTMLVGAGFRGVDAVTLVVGVPLLVVSTLRYRRGSLKGGILLTGTLAYFLYNYASMSLGAAYNSLFLVYVALLSTSLFAFVIAFTSVDRDALPSRFSDRLPRRSIAAYLFVVAVVLSVLWGGDVVSSLMGSGVPEVIGSYTTAVTYVLDLGIVAPAAVLGGILLLRRHGLGYLLASTLLIVNLTLGVALMAQGAAILRAGVPLTAGQIAAFIGSFAVLSLFGIFLTIRLLQSLSFTPPSSSHPASATREPGSRA